MKVGRKMIAELIKKAKEIFPNFDDFQAYFAPGRVNLIGEHIDYNGGYVLPCALDIGTYGVVSSRDDLIVECYSDNIPEAGKISFSLTDLNYDPKDNWTNYVKGVLKEMKATMGFNLYVHGNIPNGSGLSSSASLELLTAVIANTLGNMNYSMLNLVKFAHKAENEFIGVKCGIMDQFIIGMAENQSGILLNTASLDYQYVKINFENYLLVIGNTNKKRTLADSKYNERRAECEEGLKYLKEKFSIKFLCDLTMKEFNDNQELIGNDTVLKRVRHVISENERTLNAYQALLNNDLKSFGNLLNESHRSLKEDYEVTGYELDSMQELFVEYGAIGARMTGAGFGGCVIALVEESKAEWVISQVAPRYHEITGLKAEFYPVRVGNGARKL